MKIIITLLAITFIYNCGNSQELSFEEYDPISTLKVTETNITRAKYPFIDVHNHQFDLLEKDLNLMISQMDSINLKVMINLSGRGAIITRNENGTFSFSLGSEGTLKKFEKKLRDELKTNRIINFTNVDFNEFEKKGWLETTLAKLEKDVSIGANGLKIYKNLGMDLKDSLGNRVKTDNPLFDPIWEKCAELDIPVLIHTGEPNAFFLKKDKYNERLLELKLFPGRARPSNKYPPWETIIQEQWNVFKKHPNTIFINAHFGWMANDLDRLGKLLDDAPNVYTEFGAVIAELGRQPRRAKEFFIKYQDRILFGKDTWNPEEYHTYFRILETEDEYFPYFRKRHAFWRMYGLGLPDEVLKKIYFQNALKLIPGLDETLFNFDTSP